MLRLEPRAAPSRFYAWASPLLAVGLTALAAALLFAALGKDVARGLEVFFWTPVSTNARLNELALKATPLILCALGLVLCFRANVWNIGAEGQFLMGAIAAGGMALWATTSGWRVNPWLWLPVTVAAGALGGAAWAALVALARDRANANEILVSLMLVYVANLFLSWLVFGPWKDPAAFNFPQTARFAEGTLLPRLTTPGRLHVGYLLALAAAVGMALLMFRTYRGYRLEVGGLAPHAARYAGFSARSALWSTLLVSGAFAGVAGAFEVMGPMGQLTPHVSNGYGFTAIIVAFVGRLHPVGAVLAAFLLSMFLIGGELAQSRLGLPAALSSVFQGVLLIALLACDTLIHRRVRWVGRARTAEGSA